MTLVSTFSTGAQHSEFACGQRSMSSPDTPNSYSTAGDSELSTRYPEGNFDGNQLLDGSIGLSPPCPGVTIDLHVRTVTVLHQRFLLASTSPDIVHHLSGPTHSALTVSVSMLPYVRDIGMGLADLTVSLYFMHSALGNDMP